MNREDCLLHIEEEFEKLFQKYVYDWSQLSDDNKEDIRDYCYDLAEAVMEDVEVEKNSIAAYNDALDSGKNYMNSFFSIGNKKCDDEIYKILSEFKTWYIRDGAKIKEIFRHGEKCLRDNFKGEFLNLIYPVFVLEILNVKSIGESDSIVNYTMPLSDRCEVDNYLLMLLIADRKQSLKGTTIWGEVEKKYKEIKKYKKKYSYSECDEEKYKKLLEWFDDQKMFRETDKNEYIEHVKQLLEMNPRLVEEGVLQSEINAIIKLLNYYDSIEISNSMFIYMLNRLTGWIDLYNFCRMNISSRLVGESDNGQFPIINRIDNRIALCFQLSENEDDSLRNEINNWIKEILITQPISGFFIRNIDEIYAYAYNMYNFQDGKVGDTIYRKIYREIIELRENRVLDLISNLDVVLFYKWCK